ncbi:SGNH/GDSL hydrolase family protein [Streptomyces sp. NPDC046685]|uniref:SGNH/GDSL hydrolase family protein n=1 Tax=Streptomyces sp. NPDC046685 TaxID=3157202 RepID=UPI0033E5F499
MVLALLAVVASLVAMLSPGVANAGGKPGAATFTMSATSGQPGMTFYIPTGTQCPGGQSSSDYRVYASVTDANGDIVFNDAIRYGVPYTGVWPSDDNSPVVVPTTAAQGTATVRVWCRTGASATHLLDYTPQSYVVSGPAVDYSLSSSSYEIGETLHAESITPCTGVQFFTRGIIHDGNQMFLATDGFFLDYQVDAAAGVWEINFKIPHFIPTSSGSIEPTPTGDYTLSMSCYGERGLIYADKHFEVTASAPLNYLAMGDSYSSGEGVEPFEDGTAVPDVDICHRSTKAYARVLTEDMPSVFDLGMDGFTACSGAKTSAFTNPFNGEDPQLNDVFGNTDLITFTIGGNDMPFEDFAYACAKVSTVSCDEQPYDDAIAGIANNVIPGVQSALTSLQNKLDSMNDSGATVLVLGYPQLLPEEYVEGGLYCGWLQPQELPKIRDVITTLNTAIKNEVDAMGGNFHFVSATESDSPFSGHELCRTPDDTDMSPNYFNNVVIGQPDVYTFHPNEQGQQAYADLVKSYLSQHPLN